MAAYLLSEMSAQVQVESFIIRVMDAKVLFRCLRRPVLPLIRTRRIHQVPFQDDLSPIDEELFNLGDFKDYKEAPDVRAYRERLGMEVKEEVSRPLSRSLKQKEPLDTEKKEGIPVPMSRFEEACHSREPVVFVSKLSNPYVNLAIEDYIYNKMPLPQQENNCNRLVFYVNSPCVVIGKNQNPWKEVNLPLLNNLRIPLVRRRSGGGTVVHDSGNVNYSFMTTKDKFDRHTFAHLVKDAVNSVAPVQKQITVTERGDIVTKEGNLKVSGSAYKLSKGRSYHHGTMLLNLRLDILRQLLHRDEEKIGYVTSEKSVSSVKSPVTNLEIEQESFIESVISQFQEQYGVSSKVDKPEDEEFDQTELLGLDDFVLGFSKKDCRVVYVEEGDELPEEIAKVRDELMDWDWKYGATMPFTHTFNHKDFTVEFSIAKKGLVESFTLHGANENITQSFEFLQLVLNRGDSIKYTGSNIAGYITDDELSEWIGEAIDGTT